MATFKRRTLQLSTGRQIKLFGNSLAINNGLEIGEGSAPNIFSLLEQHSFEKQIQADSLEEEEIISPKPVGKTKGCVSNPHGLTAIELAEIADYNIRLWMDLKDKLREHGSNSPRVFNREALR